MKHVLFVIVVALYVVIIGQNWANYSAAILVAVWVRERGNFDSIPFTIGVPPPDELAKDAPPVISGT